MTKTIAVRTRCCSICFRTALVGGGVCWQLLQHVCLQNNSTKKTKVLKSYPASCGCMWKKIRKAWIWTHQSLLGIAVLATHYLCKSQHWCWGWAGFIGPNIRHKSYKLLVMNGWTIKRHVPSKRTVLVSQQVVDFWLAWLSFPSPLA